MKKYCKNMMFMITLFLLSCSGNTTVHNNGNPNPNVNLANLEIRLTDAPADYETVLLEIRNVEINMTNDANSGWQTPQNVKVGIYDLLKLSNGLDTLIGSDKFSAGTIKQIRLKLGENNLVGENGKLYPLTVPSGQTSGIKINVNTTIEANKSYKLLLDFDASQSIIKLGNSNRYLFKPTIRGFLSSVTGSIKGKIFPNNIKTVIIAISGTDSVSSYTNNSGNFLLQGLGAGNYQIFISPQKPYKEQIINNVQVSINFTKDLSQINL